MKHSRNIILLDPLLLVNWYQTAHLSAAEFFFLIRPESYLMTMFKWRKTFNLRLLNDLNCLEKMSDIILGLRSKRTVFLFPTILFKMGFIFSSSHLSKSSYRFWGGFSWSSFSNGNAMNEEERMIKSNVLFPLFTENGNWKLDVSHRKRDSSVLHVAVKCTMTFGQHAQWLNGIWEHPTTINFTV